jgi:RNA polymerase sigma factor (sigma-70 family)
MSAPLAYLNQDTRVLDMIRRGDEEGLVLLQRSSRNAVHSFILRNSGTRDDAADALQESLVILWERVRSGRFEQTAKLETFIFATAKYLWLRRLARKRREVTGTDPDETADADLSPLEAMIESEQALRVKDALQRLGEPCRTLLLLFYWEEESMDRIAHRMGFANADTAKSKKYQCKKALQHLLQEYRTHDD